MDHDCYNHPLEYSPLILDYNKFSSDLMFTRGALSQILKSTYDHPRAFAEKMEVIEYNIFLKWVI